jgi:aminoglycoside phosphotransferase (APT) family kinase protein
MVDTSRDKYDLYGKTVMESEFQPHLDFGLRLDELKGFLGNHVELESSSLNLRALTGGQSNPTYLLTSGKLRYVMRTKPRGELLQSAHAIDREYRVMSALAASDVPVPRTYAFCEDAEIIGVPFYIMEYLEGRIFDTPDMPSLNNHERAEHWDEVNRVLATLHSVKPQEFGLADFGRAGNYFERQIRRWIQQYKASETEIISEMDHLISYLPNHVPADDESRIVHGDFRIDNLIFCPNQARVIGIIDWELSTLGNPLADLAYHLTAWSLSSKEFRGMADKDLPELGIPSAQEYVDLYCSRVGRPPIVSADWSFYMAFSLFRLAAILQGIRKRNLSGNANGADASATGDRARMIARIGWGYICDNRSTVQPATQRDTNAFRYLK